MRSGLSLRLDRDGSVSEMVESVMLVLTALALAAAGVKRREGMFVVTGFAALYLLVDNFLLLHERAGTLIYPVHSRAGELIYGLVAGAIMLAAGRAMYRRMAASERAGLLALAIAMGCLGFFAVGVDAAHSVVARYYPPLDFTLGTIEDAGELLSLSLLLAVAVAILRAPGPERDDVIIAHDAVAVTPAGL